jgi:hypothetical protein
LAKKSRGSSREREFATLAYGAAIACLGHLDEFRPSVLNGDSSPIGDDVGERAEAFAATMIAWVRLRRLRAENEADWWALVQRVRRSYTPDAPPCRVCVDLPPSPTMLENVAKLLGLRLRQLVYTIGRDDPLELKKLGEMRRKLADDWRATDSELRAAILSILTNTIREPEEIAVQLAREAASTDQVSLWKPESAEGATPRRQRRRGRAPRPPTEVEVHTLLTLDRFGGNKTLAAHALGRDRSTVGKNAKRAREVIAQAAELKSRNVKAGRLPTDRRGQETTGTKDDSDSDRGA